MSKRLADTFYQGFCFKCGVPLRESSWMCPACGFVNSSDSTTKGVAPETNAAASETAVMPETTSGPDSSRKSLREDLDNASDAAKRDIRDRLRRD